MLIKTVLKLLKLSFLIMTVSAHPVTAAQFGNHYNIIGFDREDKIFAFEEFVDHDVSPGSHTSTFFVDLENDRWIEDSPIVSGSWDGGQTQDETQKVAEIIKRLGIRDNGFTAAIRSNIELYSKVLAWGGSDYHSFKYKNFVTIEEFDFNQEDDFGATCKGYRLIHNGNVVHSDAHLPGSRGCPDSYSLREVYCSGYYDYTTGYCAVIVQYNNQDPVRHRDIHFLVNPIKY